MHSKIALQRWLTSRNLVATGPRETSLGKKQSPYIDTLTFTLIHTLDPNTGQVRVGLIESVTVQLNDPTQREPNTLAEMDVWGHVDPVPYDYGYDAAGPNDGVLLRRDGVGFFNILQNIAGITEDALEEWFGPGRNVVRDRAIMLVENGHINPYTVRLMKVTYPRSCTHARTHTRTHRHTYAHTHTHPQVVKKIKTGGPSDNIYLLEAKVTLSNTQTPFSPAPITTLPRWWQVRRVSGT